MFKTDFIIFHCKCVDKIKETHHFLEFCKNVNTAPSVFQFCQLLNLGGKANT